MSLQPAGLLVSGTDPDLLRYAEIGQLLSERSYHAAAIRTFTEMAEAAEPIWEPELPLFAGMPGGVSFGGTAAGDIKADPFHEDWPHW